MRVACCVLRVTCYVLRVACYVLTCIPVYLYTCLPVYLFTCLPVYLFTCLPACHCMRKSRFCSFFAAFARFAVQRLFLQEAPCYNRRHYANGREIKLEPAEKFPCR